MEALKRRIKIIEESIMKHSGGFIAHFKNGNTQHIHPGEAILLCKDRGEEIVFFEEEQSGADNGKMKDLLNGLLFLGIDGNDGKEEA